MNEEAAVAAKVAQNLPPSQPELNPQYPQPEQPQSNGLDSNLPLEQSVMQYQLMDYFNMSKGTRQVAETRDQINAILSWAKSQSDTPDLAGVMRVLYHTETGLGSRLKTDRVGRLYQFVRIQQQRELLAQKERALYSA